MRWWPSTLARRVSQRFAAANPPTPHVSRFPRASRNMVISSGFEGEEYGKPDRRPVNPSAKDFNISLGELSASTQGMKNVENTDTAKKAITCPSYVPAANSAKDERRASGNVISGDKNVFTTALEVIDNKPDITGEIVDTTDSEWGSDGWPEEIPDGPRYPMDDFILPYSSHRDGSIYRGTEDWKRSYSIADRNETRLESTRFSDPTDCVILNGTCRSHFNCNMLQVFSIRLAKIPAEHGSVELYGYLAARDRLDPLLNYVVNISRDDPIIVKQVCASIHICDYFIESLNVPSFERVLALPTLAAVCRQYWSGCIGAQWLDHDNKCCSLVELDPDYANGSRDR